MRTAKEIKDETFNKWQSSGRPYNWVSDSINEARKELLEYLANKTYIADNNHNPVITKEEILSLIKEVK